MAYLRSAIVSQAKAWIGCKESDGSHKQIIDVYNAHTPLARGYKVQYTDAWCATFVSAVAIRCGYTAIIPTECGCDNMITLFKNLSEWVEDDAYVPSAGDVIFYDWQDSGSGDNTGSADHVGIVESVSGTTITVIEGNKSDAVGRRTMQANGRYIRGYGVPKYTDSGSTATTGSTAASSGSTTHTVAAGDTLSALAAKYGTTVSAIVSANSSKYGRITASYIEAGWVLDIPAAGSSSATKTATDAAASKDASLAGTYTVTASSLNIRSGAGTGKDILAAVPKGTKAQCYGYYTAVSGVRWLYVQVTYGGVTYVGFASSAYLAKQ